MGCQGCLKAGKTIKPSQRRKGHQTGNPFAVRIVKTWWVSSMSHAEEQLKLALCNWHVRGEWYQPPADVRQKLLSIRCLDTLLRTGRDKELDAAPPVPPIPAEFPKGVCFVVKLSPRGTTAHYVRRDGEKVVTLCGQGELTPDNYWRLHDKKVSLSMNHRTCEDCEALHSENADSSDRAK